MAALDACADIFKPAECASYFRACGYDSTTKPIHPDRIPLLIRRRTVFRYCCVDRQVCVRRQRDHGISTQALIYAELEGKRAGDAISFNGRKLVIEQVA
jgi:hypothetical protein